MLERLRIVLSTGASVGAATRQGLTVAPQCSAGGCSGASDCPQILGDERWKGQERRPWRSSLGPLGGAGEDGVINQSLLLESFSCL